MLKPLTHLTRTSNPVKNKDNGKGMIHFNHLTLSYPGLGSCKLILIYEHIKPFQLVKQQKIKV
jgi:hypothetical protein